ncbi:metallophosphoesterase [Thermincola ferriacetica]|uniref:Metallophosphoesterase n=1 Tax=Thermincola ferriacetica TaxID=281456 RepID=A0A0L6W3C8_9FIRM|nr:metallophosphoesterase [Thermincola ferriacetica]KNZ70040.1 metallophosphoesterase [Thermincola ferriacetica]
MSRNLIFVAIFTLILVIYGLMNYYIGLRGWQAVGRTLPWLNVRVYWTLLWLAAHLYIIARFLRNMVPLAAERWLVYVGAYWLAAFYYLFLIVLLLDLLRLLDRWLKFIPGPVKASPALLGWGVIALVAGLLAYGTWNAHNPVVTHYDININKRAGQMKELHIVMASDLHLGLIMNNRRLERFVSMARELNPDMVLLPGDIVDESVRPFIEEKMAKTFRKLNPPLGIYAVPGNHEHFGEDSNETFRYLNEAGIQVLVDRYVKVNDSFYIVGRDDTGHGRKSRKALAEVLKDVDRSLPLIMLDHNPSRPSLQEAAEQGIDLQLSGHTHKGQFIFNNLITGRIYERDWGYLRKGPYQLIVSNGFGTWGPPIRIGNRPEIVDIVIRFSPTKT